MNIFYKFYFLFAAYTSVHHSLLPKVYSYIYTTALFAAPQPLYTFYLLYAPLTAEINSFIFVVEEVPVLVTYLALCKSQMYEYVCPSPPACML